MYKDSLDKLGEEISCPVSDAAAVKADIKKVILATKRKANNPKTNLNDLLLAGRKVADDLANFMDATRAMAHSGGAEMNAKAKAALELDELLRSLESSACKVDNTKLDQLVAAVETPQSTHLESSPKNLSGTCFL